MYYSTDASKDNRPAGTASEYEQSGLSRHAESEIAEDNGRGKGDIDEHVDIDRRCGDRRVCRHDPDEEYRERNPRIAHDRLTITHDGNMNQSSFQFQLPVPVISP